MKVAVVGAGSWGTAFAGVMEGRGHDVTLAGRDASDNDGVAAAELLCVAVPSRVFREVTSSLPGTAPIVILTKGLDPGTGKRLSQVVEGRDRTCSNPSKARFRPVARTGPRASRKATPPWSRASGTRGG